MVRIHEFSEDDVLLAAWIEHASKHSYGDPSKHGCMFEATQDCHSNMQK